MSDFEINQTVTVMRSFGSDLAAVASIARMTKRKIILSNGMEFNIRGTEWGHSGHYGRHLRAYRDGDRERIRRQNLLTRMDRVKWHELSDEQLIRVYEIVSPKDD